MRNNVVLPLSGETIFEDEEKSDEGDYSSVLSSLYNDTEWNTLLVCLYRPSCMTTIGLPRRGIREA